MKSHKTSSSTRFSPILSPLPLPQHLDVQPPTYHLFFDLRLLGDKVFHRVFREKLFKLTVELGRQGLIVSDNQSRLVQGLYHIGHGKGLARSRNTQQCLCLIAFLKALHQLRNGCGLVAGGLVFAV